MFLSTGFSEEYHGAACLEHSAKNIDLSSQMGPIRDQGSTGWCYAYGLADQLSYLLKIKNAPGFDVVGDNRVSPAGIALDWSFPYRREAYTTFASKLKETTSLNAQKGKLLDQVLNYSLQNKVIENFCIEAKNSLSGIDENSSEAQKKIAYAKLTECHRLVNNECAKSSVCSVFLNKLNKLSSDNTSSSMQKINFQDGAHPYNPLKDLLRLGVFKESEIRTDQSQNTLSHDIGNLYSHVITSNYLQNPDNPTAINNAEYAVKSIFPKFTGNILSVIQNYEVFDPYKQFMFSATRTPIADFISNTTVADLEIATKDHDPLEKVDRALEAHLPVGITYDANFFFYGPNFIKSFNPKLEPASHYSIIIGKRFNCKTGETEYILRNSWGPNACEEKRSSYQSLPLNNADQDHLDVSLVNCAESCRITKSQNCENTCLKNYSEKNIALNKPDFLCENGNFIIKKNTLINSVYYTMIIE